MKLSEALIASKSREAIGYLAANNASFKFPMLDELVEAIEHFPIATATDTCVEYLMPNLLTIGYTTLRVSWIDILPEDQAALFKLRWEPIEPKDSLTQLAEALEDWREDV